MDVLLISFFTLLGLMVGSFLNVVVLRFGFSERAAARSHCAQCEVALHPIDLVPVLSYVFLGGRCRTCGSGLSAQYPLVELSVAALFGITYAVMEPQSMYAVAETIAFLGFWAALVALVAYDIRHTLIPLPFVYALIFFGGAAAAARALAAGTLEPLGLALIAAMVCGGFFALIHVLTRGRGMGIGDAYVASGIGLALGVVAGIAACIYGVWLGAIIGLLLLGIGRVFPHGALSFGGRRVTLGSEIPFAPFLALGAVIAFTTPLATIMFGAWGFFI